MKLAISVLAVLPLALSAPVAALADSDPRVPDVPTAGVAQSGEVLPIIPVTAIPAGAIVVGGLVVVGGVVIAIASSDDGDSTPSTVD